MYSEWSTVTIESSRAIDSSIIQYCNYLLIKNNLADTYAVIYLVNSGFRGNYPENVTFLNNIRSLMAFNSIITFSPWLCHICE